MKARYLLGAAAFALVCPLRPSLAQAPATAVGSLGREPPPAASATARGAGGPARLPSADSPILLQGDQIIYDGDAETESVVGHVEMDDDGYILLADSVTYDQKTDKVTARGHISLTDPKGNVAFANEMVLTDRFRNGALTGFGALIGENGRLAAASAQRIGGNTVIANHTAYTPCKICDLPGQRTPVWQVKSERVVYDQDKHRIHFYNATLDFFGVPVLYTPFLSQPDPTIRYASGLLAPDIGNSTKIGYFLRAPVYIAISSNNDATLAGMHSTEGGDMLEGEYRARWNNSGMWLQGSATYSDRGGLGGGGGAQTYDHLFGAGRFQIDDSWQAGFDTQLTNNPAYMRFYDISYLDRLVNDLFANADWGRSRFLTVADYFQGLRSTDIASNIPVVLPDFHLSLIPTRNILGGPFRFDLSGLALSRSNGNNDQRLTAEALWKWPLLMPGGQLWTLMLDGRGDEYHVETAQSGLPARTQFIARGTGYAELDWRWPFIAEGNRGRAYILEPIAQLIAQPYGGNPKGLPNEDSADFEFDENNIFSAQQVPGYDVIESGPRANLGLRAEALFAGGEAEALLGQTYRLKPDPVLAGTGAGSGGSSSDIVGRASIRFPHLSFADRIDLDRGDGTLRRHEIYVTGTYGRSSLEVSYVQLPSQTASLGLGSRREANVQTDINFYENWQAFAAVRRDLEAGKMLDSEFGLGYEDECLAISLAYRRKYTFDPRLGVPPSTSFILRFTLKTGDQPVRPFSLFPRDVFTTTHP